MEMWCVLLYSYLIDIQMLKQFYILLIDSTQLWSMTLLLYSISWCLSRIFTSVFMRDLVCKFLCLPFIGQVLVTVLFWPHKTSWGIRLSLFSRGIWVRLIISLKCMISFTSETIWNWSSNSLINIGPFRFSTLLCQFW